MVADHKISRQKGGPYRPPKDGRCIINTLPTELLAHIFALGPDWNEYDEESEEDWEEDEPDFVILVSHVCRHWREVAINTPALWTSIDFSEGHPYARSAVYLERSENAPLDLCIDFTEDGLDEEGEQAIKNMCDMQRILQLILPHVHHWRSLDVSVSDYHLMHDALLGMSRCPVAPSLEILQLYHYEDDDNPEAFSPAHLKEQPFVLFNGNVPRLTKVALWGVHLNWSRSLFLCGLVDLELAYHAKDVRPSFKDFARILRDSPELSKLSLCQSGPAGGPVDWLASILDQPPDVLAYDEMRTSPEPSATTTIMLSSLKELVLAFLETDYSIELLKRLAMPNLSSLALEFDEIDSSEFLRAITRPSSLTGKSILSGLQALKLSGMECEDSQVIRDVYAAMPNLNLLNLNFDFISMRWYHELADQWDAAADSNQTPFLPRLQAFSATGLAGPDLRALVEFRKALGLPIKQLYVNEEDQLDEEDEHWFIQNVQEFEYFEGSDEEEMEEEEIIDVGIEGEDFEDEFGHEDAEDLWNDVD
ncbi:uncharacterized protein LAESUDRAFT_163766 [Laetiporus sulphureus 93-53]|uniref:F-box domain-containing protein n=1 Tax=Laetiporus sulphureus 93-53 TaxID=1314785 RepID=A0A165HQ08_9APHY|nr:uncharacterized protein LAESUDRAFT_163766 [Laetiporus sulphureus 93-53]KZT12031.1 hypothetical protein LAESUDRAFT_163766 [Laetiporus sulphureus 93-53]